MLFYGILFIALWTAEKLFLDPDIFSASAFLNWDAMHYDTIRREAYTTGMVAFFPLFPFTWKLLHAGPIGVSIFNGLLFIVSFSWLAEAFRISVKILLLLASGSSLIFMFLPFSEAMFFFTTAMLLVGLKKNHRWLIWSGIFFSGLVRPVATIFIPSILLLHFLFTSKEERKNLDLLLQTGICLLSLLIVFALQYVQTGDPLAFVHVQRGWGNYLRLPSMPLNSWAGGLILRLDALSFFFGISAAIVLAWVTLHKNAVQQQAMTRPVLFSVSYLAFLSFIILFTRGGILNSLNRYLFCSAFFVIAMNDFLSRKIFSARNVLILLVGSGLFWLLFGSYVHIQTLLKFEFLSLYLFLLFTTTSSNMILKNTSYYLVMACNIFFLFFFYHRFLSGGWVG